MPEPIAKVLAFYLPQFYPIAENDDWWGKGFTEWTNVRQGKPLFAGHYQPRVPADLGYYDLKNGEVMADQVRLALEYGVHGFVFYHYWFAGRRLLDVPVHNFVHDPAIPPFPFCLCWANESWTRRWDGLDQEVLLAQTYSEEDDLRHIRSLLPLLKNDRYLRVDGKPLFLIYRTEHLPDPAKTAAVWKQEAQKAGLPGLHLLRVESLAHGVDPRPLGFDGAVEFAPDWRHLGPEVEQPPLPGHLPMQGNRVFSYHEAMSRTLSKPLPDYPLHRGAFPGWDNSPRRRRGSGATILHGSTPQAFQAYLESVLLHALLTQDREHRLVFVNAWNEWGEGCYLEPDQRLGYGYLEAVRRALERFSGLGELMGDGLDPEKGRELFIVVQKMIQQRAEAQPRPVSAQDAVEENHREQCKALTRALEDIHASLGWRAISRARRLKESLFPPGTARRSRLEKLLSMFRRTM